jgi:hypothetical protein
MLNRSQKPNQVEVSDEKSEWPGKREKHTQRAPAGLPFLVALQNTVNEKIEEAINNATLLFDSKLIHSFAGSQYDSLIV